MQIATYSDLTLSQYPYLEHFLLDQYKELVYDLGGVPDIDDLISFAVLYVNDTLREQELDNAWEHTNIPRDHGYDDYLEFREAVLEDHIEELIPENLLDEFEVRDDIFDYLMRQQIVFRQDTQFFNVPVVEVW